MDYFKVRLERFKVKGEPNLPNNQNNLSGSETLAMFAKTQIASPQTPSSAEEQPAIPPGQSNFTDRLDMHGCVFGDDAELCLPDPKPYFEKKTSALTFPRPSILPRGRSESPHKDEIKSRRKQLMSSVMSKSMSDFHFSRASHNRSTGLALQESDVQTDKSEARKSAASRVAEFGRLLGDL